MSLSDIFNTDATMLIKQKSLKRPFTKFRPFLSLSQLDTDFYLEPILKSPVMLR